MYCATPELKILSPTGILGYGFPAESLEIARSLPLDAIAVDAGSSDGGAAYLSFEPNLSGGGVSEFLDFVRRDLEPLLLLAIGKGIALIIGSAGSPGDSDLFSAQKHMAAANLTLQPPDPCFTSPFQVQQLAPTPPTQGVSL